MKSLASLSVDLDNKWSYMKIHGDSDWEEFPSYLDVVTPRIIDFASDIGLRMTVFVVGQDAALSQNHDALSQLGESGLEIGNHSFHHEPWLHLKTDEEVSDEIIRADEAISEATGMTPVGFRGPGFSVSQSTIRSLVRAGYVYDASTLPTFIGPLARAFYLRSTGMDSSERDRRDQLFGNASDGLRPIEPYLWEMDDGGELLEIPVTTMPVLKVPIHVTYLFYLARISPKISKMYLSAALAMCRWKGVEPSLLLHSLDFLGHEDVAGLEFFPGMDLSGETKRELLADYISILGRDRHIVSMAEHASALSLGSPKRVSLGSLA